MVSLWLPRDVATVEGTGDAVRDATLLANAVSLLNDNGGGVLQIRGTVIVDSSYTFTTPISILGVGPDPTIESRAVTGVEYLFGWNPTWVPSDETQHGITTPNAFAPYFSSVSYAPTDGDWVILQADDEITGLSRHAADKEQRPMELHQVHHYDPSTNRGYTANTIIDPITTAGLLTPVTMTSDVEVANLNFRHTTVTAPDFVSTLQFHRCLRPLVDSCRFDRLGPGDIFLSHCAEGTIRSVVIEGSMTDDDNYGIWIRGGNGITISGCSITGARHAITTAGSNVSGKGSHRYGTPLNIRMVDNVIRVPSKFDGSAFTTRVGLDTHPEGWGVVFENNMVFVSGDIGNVGIQTRSRATLIKGNRVIGTEAETAGSNTAMGIRTYATDTAIVGNQIEHCWQGVVGDESATGDNTNRCRIIDNHFKNTRHPIVLDAGSGHYIKGYTHENVAFSSTGSPAISQSHIVFGDDCNTGAAQNRVANCDLSAGNAANSIDTGATLVAADIRIEGSVMTGYGSADAGVTLGAANTAAAALNWVDA